MSAMGWTCAKNARWQDTHELENLIAMTAMGWTCVNDDQLGIPVEATQRQAGLERDGKSDGQEANGEGTQPVKNICGEGQILPYIEQRDVLTIGQANIARKCVFRTFWNKSYNIHSMKKQLTDVKDYMLQ